MRRHQRYLGLNYAEYPGAERKRTPAWPRRPRFAYDTRAERSIRLRRHADGKVQR